MAWNLRQAAQSHPGAGSFVAGVKRPSQGALPPAPDAKAKPKPKPKTRTEKKETKPNYNKKVGSKISQLSGKVTEIRCLQTNLQSSSLFLVNIFIQLILWVLLEKKQPL